MTTYRVICDRCGAAMTRTESRFGSAFVCPYCGAAAHAQESDRVRTARFRAGLQETRMEYAQRERQAYRDWERRLLPIRCGFILVVFLLVLALWDCFMR